MQEEAVTEGSEKSVWLLRICFIAYMLVSLDKLRLTELAISGNSPSWLKLDVAAPWVLGALFGFRVWRGWKRDRMTNIEVSGVLLFMGSMVWVTYDALERLSAHWH